MANTDRPNGARPIGSLTGSSWQGHVRAFEVDGNGADIFPGDFVEMTAGGYADVATAGAVDLIGVMVGRADVNSPAKVAGITSNFISSSSPNDERQWYDASVDGASQILVCVGPDVLYEIQEDDGGTALTVAAIGANVDIVGTAGSDVSRQELDQDSVSATDGQLRLIGLVDRPDNEYGDNARWVVKINESHYTKIAGVQEA